MSAPGLMRGPLKKDYIGLWLLAAVISVSSLALFFHQHAILLYGDAVAHISIARRTFDSRTPGLFELGTVWLPLPHILDIPFLVNDWMWRTGIGGSIVSMAAYLAATLGIFRLVSSMASRWCAWLAALVFLLNPNLIYLQSTAMTEPLYLALFIWAVVFFSDFALRAGTENQSASRALERCGMVLAAGMLVRYDGWFLSLAVMLWSIVLITKRRGWPALRRSLLECMALVVLVPCLWLAYNWGAYGNALEFANGPYSARAIAARSRTSSMPSNPGEGSPRTATLYFLKAARENTGTGAAEYMLPGIAFAALVALFYFARRFLPWTLLWLPLVFYAVSIAWQSVPVFVPDWWPFSYYNVRYGLELLPAISVFFALGFQLASVLVTRRSALAGVAVLLAGWSYWSVWRDVPICLREARANGAARMQFEQKLASELAKIPQAATLLMYAGGHPGALQDAGIPFVRVIREGNHPQWEKALSDPAHSADYIVAIEGDEVSYAVRSHQEQLRVVAIIDTPGQPPAFIYVPAR